MRQKNIVFIGSGNVATHLSRAFIEAGHKIIQVWSRDVNHANELASQLHVATVERLEDIDRGADFYVIAVPDDHIAEVASRMPAVEGIVLHTSGSVAMDAIGHERRGVIWFPHSFVKGELMSYDDLQCCYEGSSPKVDSAIKKLLDGAACDIYRLDSEQRRWAHLASVITNNFSHALNTLGEQIMEQHGLDFAMLRPLIMATAKRVMKPGLAEGQTGPAARNDERTIAAHIQMLSCNKEALKAYEAMTELIQSFQKSSGRV